MTTYHQSNQSVNNQTNIGRDQIIHNLILVGQFLDFAKVEGLIPKENSPSDFSTVIDAFENTFDKRLRGDLVQATASAGVILSEVMLRYVPKQHPVALRIRKILSESPHLLYQKLNQMDFWNTFCEVSIIFHDRVYGGEAEVIWLYSHQILWKKYFKKNELFGIAIFREPYRDKDVPSAFLCKISSDWPESVRIGDTEGLKQSINTRQYAQEVKIDDVSYQDFRILMAGLAIDLIRMCSIASNDIQFWQGLISLLKIK